MKRFLLALGTALTIVAPTGAVLAQDQVAIGAAPSWAKPSELRAVPSDPQGAVFVRRQDTLVHLTDKGQVTYIDSHLRLLHPQALQLGNIQLAWNPASGPPVLHRLEIHRDGEIIDLLGEAQFEILRREDNLEQAMLDGLLTAVLQIPDLRIDDELAIAYSLPTHDPTLQEQSYGLLAMADNPGQGRFRLGLSWDKGQEPTTRLTDDFGPTVSRSKQAIDIRFDDPVPVMPPTDAPPRYNWTRVLEYSDFGEWATISKRIHPLFETAATITPGSSLEREADRIMAAHAEADARVAAALQLVQRQVRYIYVGLNGGNYTPATAEETWSRRYGDCKGKTVLLMALLDRMGIAHEAVLVSNQGLDDGLDTRLPNPAMFDHILVRAEVDGQTLWLDGTLPDVIGPSERPSFAYRNVLPLSAEGQTLEAVPQTPFALPQEMVLYDIDASAGVDDPAGLTLTTVTRGPSGIGQHLAMSAATPNQMTEHFRNEFLSGDFWQSLDSVDYRFDKATGASVMVFKGTIDLDWDRDDDDYDLTLPGGGFSPPSRRTRRAGTGTEVPFYSAPEYSCYVTTVRLPDDTEFDNWSHNSVFDTQMFGRVYYRSMELNRDRTLRMVRGSRVDQPEIGQAQAERDNARIDAFDNSKALLSYSPDGARGYRTASRVPAVTEFDWAGANPPCLPRDLLAKN